MSAIGRCFFGSFDQMSAQDGSRHRTDSARNGSYRFADRLDFFKIDIAAHIAVIIYIDPDIDNDLVGICI